MDVGSESADLPAVLRDTCIGTQQFFAKHARMALQIARMFFVTTFQTYRHCAQIGVHYLASCALGQTGAQVIGVTSAYQKIGQMPNYVQLDVKCAKCAAV